MSLLSFYTLPNTLVTWEYIVWKRVGSRMVYFNLQTHLISPFRPSVAFHIETSHLFCSANQMTGFYMKFNTGLTWVDFNIVPNIHHVTLSCYWSYSSVTLTHQINILPPRISTPLDSNPPVPLNPLAPTSRFWRLRAPNYSNVTEMYQVHNFKFSFNF